MKGIILANGSISDYSKIEKHITTDSILICADGGYNHAIRMGLTPKYVIGDMDSVTESIANIKTKKFSTDKDETDTELAIDIALKEGCDHIVLLAASGTRLDHTIANIILLLKLEKQGILAELIDEHNIIRVISKKTEFTATPNDTISLIPITNCEGVSSKGLVYPLNGENLKLGCVRGISNRFINSHAVIDIKSGYMLVIRATD